VTPDFVKYTTAEKKIIRAWEPDSVLDSWSAEAARRGLPWLTTHKWNEDRMVGAIHASSFHNTCVMFSYLERMGAKGTHKFGGKTTKIMDLGTVVGLMINYWQGTRAKDRGYIYTPEVRVSPWEEDTQAVAVALMLCGHADGMTIGWPIDKPILWEYKSIGRKGFANLTKPSKQYIEQIHIYMACLGIPYCIILYHCKDTGQNLSYKIHFDNSVWDRIVTKASAINSYAHSIDVDPPRRTGTSCYYCAYYEECDPPIPPRRKKHVSGAPVI